MMKKRVKSDRRGYTLAETLIAILILLMVASILAAGLPAAVNALNKAVDASHGQVLLSTTMTMMRDELSTASGIVCNEKTITYTDAWGSSCVLEVKGTDGIYLSKTASPDGTGGAGKQSNGLLVSGKAATSGLYCTFSKAVYDEGRGIVKILELQVKKGDRVLSDLGELAFEIEVIGNKG